MDDTVATAREDFLRARGAETAAEVALDAADAEVAALESLLHAAERRKEAARAALAAAREPARCTGSGLCRAKTHVHGCFADTGNCDDPSDHAAREPVTQDGRTLADYVADLADAGPDTPVDLRRPEYALAVLLHHVDAEWAYLVGRVFDTLAARPSAPTVTAALDHDALVGLIQAADRIGSYDDMADFLIKHRGRVLAALGIGEQG
jgi:hypothetical protein